MKIARRMCWALLVATIFAAAVSRPVLADDDPPGRVARLNLSQGSVSFLPAGGADNDWAAAIANRPMTTGDRLWTDQDGRAELHVGSTAIRIDRNTGISFLTLSDGLVQLQLSAGTTVIRLRRLDPNDAFEIDAPNLAFSLLRPGEYRLETDPDRNVTTVTVVQGQGEVTGGGRSWNLIADQRATFSGTDNLDYVLADVHAAPPSEFDSWCDGRDQREDRAASASARYVPPDMTGSEDLDTYGAWQTDPTYGPLWVPAGVGVGWAPYRFGHWVWVAPWGWTWIEDEPWGFAPFHYGRWVNVRGFWGWVPGPVAVRPVYAPALVAWVGGTPGFSFSVAIGSGGIGWFPLGPREVFVPGYRVSDAYVTRVNVTNTVVERTRVVNVYHNNVTNITYVNQHVNGGVTVVSHETFVNARPVGRNVVAVPQREIEAAPVARTFAAAPVRTSFVGEGRPGAARPPAAIINRTVVTRRTPAPAPARFEDQPGDRGGAFGNRGNGQPANGQPAARTVQPTAPAANSQPQPVYRPGQRGQGGPPAPESPQRGTFETGNGGNGNVPGRGVQPSQSSQPSQGSQPSQSQADDRGRTRTFEQQGTPQTPQQQPRGQFEGGNTPSGNVPANRGVQSSQPPQQSQPQRGQFGGGNGNSNTPASQNPYTRPAPPVHPATPAEQQTDNARQGQWQQQHEQIHPREAPQGRPGGGQGGGGQGGGGDRSSGRGAGRDDKKH